MFPLIPQTGIDEIRLQNQQREIPDEGDGVEEIGVAAAGVDPEVVERRAQKRGVQKGREGGEGVAVG